LSEDAEIMRRVQAGDPAALGLLMERWEAPIKGLLARLLQNSGEAEDLAEETFVRVWQQRARFRPEAQFRPWIFAIAVNLARNRLRWWRRRPTVALRDWDGAEDPASGPGTGGAAMEKHERAEAVRAAIAALPRKWRESIVLFEFERMPCAEIAAAVGATPKAVESRLHRARAALRQSLRAWMEV
jgi:RNA polymerase sigma-70 factor (ECF subfamily)